MYLSRLVLNPKSRTVRHTMGDCQDLHRTVMSAFPRESGMNARMGMGVLHRLEVSARTGKIILYVQSKVKPDWSRLEQDYLAEAPAVKSVSAAYANIREGAVLVFRLLANPTRKIDTKSGSDGTRRNGRRIPLNDEYAQMEWLARKGEVSGFELCRQALSDLPDARALQERASTSTVGQHPNGHLTLDGVLFEGHLRVTDAGLFREALVSGIGPGKAYGFGLLSIAPRSCT